MSFQQRRYTDCDTMEITEYERLVSSETEALQSKMTMAIDAAMNTIQTKQSELMMEIRSDPRKSAIPKKSIKLVLQISSEQERGENGSQRVPLYVQRPNRKLNRNRDNVWDKILEQNQRAMKELFGPK